MYYVNIVISSAPNKNNQSRRRTSGLTWPQTF